MSIITCLKELNKRGCLENYDTVIFIVDKQIIEYKVMSNYLHCRIHNNMIFHVLKVNKDQLLERTYGYEPIHFKNALYCWAESKENDYLALTRSIRELYKIIEERNKIYTKYNRFEIMDI